jgi:hypothetical protein
VAKSDQCDFARWLADLSLSDQQSKECQRVRELHGKFHTSAAYVLELALSGKKDEAKEQLAMAGEFTKISSELVLAVAAWKRAVSTR